MRRQRCWRHGIRAYVQNGKARPAERTFRRSPESATDLSGIFVEQDLLI